MAVLTTAFLLANNLSAFAADSIPANEAETLGPTTDDEPPAQTDDKEPPTQDTDNTSLAFSAYIDNIGQGYAVYGSAEFPADTCGVQNLYSLDGENYEVYHREWVMPGPITSGCAIKTPQICLQANDEPLQSYLAGTLDRFYVKLRITRDDGTTYESEAALIERNREPQPVPDDLALIAGFDPSIRVFGMLGNKRCFYGKYQLTVKENATAEEINSCLPKTLPVRVQVGNGICDIDCPVTWKPITVTELTPDESVSIANAAEPIYVPAGTLLDTPMGVYQLDEPLLLGEEPWAVNEILLVLNVISAGEVPSNPPSDPPHTPVTGGSGGNEGNAGSDNREDSTAEGQRPNLPQQPEDNETPIEDSEDVQTPDSTTQPDENENVPEADSGDESNPDNSTQPDESENLPKDREDEPNTDSSTQSEGHEDPPKDSEAKAGNDSPIQLENLADSAKGQRPSISQPPEDHQTRTVNNPTTEIDENPVENIEMGQTFDDTERTAGPAEKETIAAQGLTSQSETAPAKNNAGGPVALLAIAGTAGIAGVYAAISGKGAAAFFSHGIGGKIRALLHLIIKR